MGLGLPGVADAADGFAEAHGEIDNGLEALGVHGEEAIAVCEKKFGVAEDAGERVVDFVAKHFADILGAFAPRGAEREFGNFCPAKTAFEKRSGQRNEVAGANQEIGLSAGDEPCRVGLAFGGSQEDYGGNRSDLLESFDDRRVAEEIIIQKDGLRRELTGQFAQFRQVCRHQDVATIHKANYFACHTPCEHRVRNANKHAARRGSQGFLAEGVH